MNEKKIIEEYFLRVDEVTNMIRGLSEDVKEDIIVHKVLRSQQMRFNGKIPTIEYIFDLRSLIMDQFLGTLKTYEMIVGKDNF